MGTASPSREGHDGDGAAGLPPAEVHALLTVALADADSDLLETGSSLVVPRHSGQELEMVVTDVAVLVVPGLYQLAVGRADNRPKIKRNNKCPMLFLHSRRILYELPSRIIASQ